MNNLDLIETHPPRVMTAAEEALARQFYAAVQHASNSSARSIQASGHKIGISDLGYCSEKIRRHIDGQTEEPTDKLAAFIGTALGDHIEQAITTSWPDAITQAEVNVVLEGDQGMYHLTGHPDVIDPAGTVVDIKTVRGLGVIRRTGPSQQQQFQRHLYAFGAHNAGLFQPSVSLSEVTVGNVWFDRSGDEHECHVQAEPFDIRMVEAATTWLDDVVYAYRHGEQARKEPPIEMCRVVCGFYLDCRAGDGHVEGLLTDPGQLAAVEMHREAIELERRARKLKDEAKAALVGVQGSTGSYAVRWVKVAGGRVEYDRAPYEKLSVTPLR